MKKVFVAIDFSPASLAGLARAREVAGDDGAIRLFHAVAPYPYRFDPEESDRLTEELVERARRLLDDRAQDLRNAGFAQVECGVAIGRPADEILTAAQEWKADIIIIGAHARSAANRILLGTVSEEVARRSPIPVLVVREPKGVSKIERVLVAVDHEPPSRHAARIAMAFAADSGLPIEAIHVIDLPSPPPWAGPFPRALGELTPELAKEIRCRVESDLETALGGEKIPIRFVWGSAAGEILRHARPSDVIVCGTHGRGALARFTFGSVATKLLRKAPCPVLVVRPAEKPAAKKTPSRRKATAR